VLLLRRLAPLVAAPALVLAVATPVAAVPEGWSDPDPVSGLTVLWMLVGIPVGLFGLVVLMVYVPSLVRGEKAEPGSGRVEEQWIGGPRSGTRELAAPDGEDSRAGGARGTW
jgi:hypothetical protein